MSLTFQMTSSLENARTAGEELYLNISRRSPGLMWKPKSAEPRFGNSKKLSVNI